MKNPMVVAALFSAVIAAVVSVVTAYWTVQLEREITDLNIQLEKDKTALNIQLERDKAAIAAQQNALQQLISARLQNYSEAYRLISQLNKDADAGGVDLDYLEKLRLAFDAWDSRHAYLLGPVTTNTANAFRGQLSTTINNSNQGKFDKNEFNKLLGLIGPLELGLRGDLGVYGLEVDGQEITTPTVRDYFVGEE